ncbi:MAG: hypothetical protein OXF74_10950 [Rhodobacteraceae bacterium]|nr:hypothetical protein [Paracoccaceae bacterium]
MHKDGQHAEEVPLAWFGKSLWKFTPLYVELMFLAICLRLIGLVEPFIFQVIIDRILPFQREASLLVVVLIFAGVSMFQLGFEVLSELLSRLAANPGLSRLKIFFLAFVRLHDFLLKNNRLRQCDAGYGMDIRGG